MILPVWISSESEYGVAVASAWRMVMARALAR
jgi:hypothetical protein